MKKLSILEQTGHQGDTQWFKLASLPYNAKPTNKKFIAASEQSGSIHALGGKYKMYELDDSFVVECEEDCILNHTFAANIKNLDSAEQLPIKDHPPAVIEKGVYLVGIQNRFDPLEGIKKRVID